MAIIDAIREAVTEREDARTAWPDRWRQIQAGPALALRTAIRRIAHEAGAEGVAFGITVVGSHIDAGVARAVGLADVVDGDRRTILHDRHGDARRRRASVPIVDSVAERVRADETGVGRVVSTSTRR